jgi:drug/metabolite transporter (DMT)-like permease
MFEPVAASVVAWFWLDETLAVSQLVGGAIVLVGIVLAETARIQQT